MNRMIAVMIAVIGFNLMACCCGGAGRQPHGGGGAELPKPPSEKQKSLVTPGDYISQYGEPTEDRVASAEPAKRFQLYRNADVKITFTPEGDERPVKSWKAAEFHNLATNEIITEDAARKKIETARKAAWQAKQAEIAESRKNKVTRENYHKVQEDMTFDEVKEILGNNYKENFRTNNSANVTWSDSRSSCRITVSFERLSNGAFVKSKSIIGD